jgi:hypothetical protein
MIRASPSVGAGWAHRFSPGFAFGAPIIVTTSFLQPGPTCRRSRLPGWLRLAITFGVLLALKYALPMTGIASVGQVLILLVVATCFAWQFWWNCSADRRGVLLLVGLLWLAGAIKVWRL